MGSALCKTDKALDEQAVIVNKQIDQQLRKERMAERRTMKILLLGSADSGKSTIAKQMRILHADGFNDSELINYRYMVFTNMVVAYHHMCRGSNEIGISITDPDKKIFDLFLNHHLRVLDYQDEDMTAVLSAMRNSEFTKVALAKMDSFYMPDNSRYLFTNAHRILNMNYSPTETDVIHARASTTGVHEIGFNFRKFFIRLIDVGGQRTERRKWIHCFENVTAVLFVAALSAYDLYLDEEPSVNALTESLNLFSSMFANEFLSKCSFILFLNKMDILADKVKHVQYSKFFPEFKGENNFEEVRDHIRDQFIDAEQKIAAASNAESPRHVYLHFTNATDKANIDYVFGAACDIILQNNLTRAGMS